MDEIYGLDNLTPEGMQDAIKEGKKSFDAFGPADKLWSKECPWRHDTEAALIFWRSYADELNKWISASEVVGTLF